MALLHKALFAVLFPPLTILVSGICICLSRVGKNAWLAHWFESQWARLALLLAGVSYEADLSKLRPGEPYVFMANHQSQFDILVLFAALRAWNVRFVAKEELFKIPIFGHAMLITGHIPILRENSRKAMRSIDDAAAAAERGLSILIFPEGTRTRDPEHLGEFKIGGMIMALKCKRPVAPVIITGTWPVLPRGRWLPNTGKVRVEALDPFEPSERFTIKQREQFKAWFKEHMDAAYEERKACHKA